LVKDDTTRLVVSNPSLPEQLLQDYAMQTQHDVFLLLISLVLVGGGFLIVYKLCETIERVWKK